MAKYAGAPPAEALGVLEARLQRRRDQRLEVAPPELGVGILAGDDLALLGDAQPAGDAARRLREDGVEARAAAAADGAATAVEQAQLRAVRAEGLDQQHLAAVELPVGAEVAAVLVAVRVAEHHLLPVAAPGDHLPVDRHRERRAHDVAAAREVVDGLEQRDDVDGQRRAAQQPDLLQQHGDLEQVGGRLAFGDHVVRQRGRAVARVDVGGGAQDRELGDACAPSSRGAARRAAARRRARARAARRGRARPARRSPPRRRRARAARRRQPRARRCSGAGRARRGGSRRRRRRGAAGRGGRRPALSRRGSRARWR